MSPQDLARVRPADVFIVGLPRSGTTVFRKWLTQIGGVNCNEIFTAKMHEPHSYFGYLHRRLETAPDLILPWNQRRVFQDFIAELQVKAGGLPLILDTKYQTLNYVPQQLQPGMRRPYLFQFMRENGAHMVQMIRRNKLRMILSEEISKATGIWGLHRDPSINPEFEKPKVTLNVPAVMRRIQRYGEMDQAIQRLFDPLPTFHQIPYEALFDPSGAFSDSAAKIAEACLPGPIPHRRPDEQRVNPEPLAALIENHRDVVAALSDGPFAWMLEDDG